MVLFRIQTHNRKNQQDPCPTTPKLENTMPTRAARVQNQFHSPEFMSAATPLYSHKSLSKPPKVIQKVCSLDW
jgi:hypothetical protein